MQFILNHVSAAPAGMKCYVQAYLEPRLCGALVPFTAITILPSLGSAKPQ